MFHEFFSSFYSLAVHPNKLLIATGQATGHDRREGRVRKFFFKFNIYLIQSSKKNIKRNISTVTLLAWKSGYAQNKMPMLPIQIGTFLCNNVVFVPRSYICFDIVHSTIYNCSACRKRFFFIENFCPNSDFRK